MGISSLTISFLQEILCWVTVRQPCYQHVSYQHVGCYRCHGLLQVRDLEGELEGEVRRSAEAQREARRLERAIKELTYQVLQKNTLGSG